ncbi:fimbrial protein [Halobacteriovorax sp. JY17]|uniref:fimbrial protein n=1 Tax=Halobacteriovorax sp. JY17 TaxID=2014617 RepID=UPI000C4C43CF|nr:fimbrial protein [Halobacteriovorax sp. JY17]PIK15600.1 MAG: fimbrial protein [Halobacteriovorax sp. JY17]
MKKTLIATAAMVIMANPIFAATQGTLLLQGQVDQVLSLTVTAESGVNTNLDLVNGEEDLKVAVVTEETNSNTGYKILVRSANGGLLKNGALDSVAYTVKYDGEATARSLTTSDVAVKNVSTGGVYDHESDFEVSLTGSGSAAALTQGTYSDTVTFTIQVN